MKQKIRRISALGIAILLLVSTFSWVTPVSAGATVWSAETIPGRADNLLGPAGIDVRDFAVAGDGTTIYAVPGDSISDNVVYRSPDAGASWTAINLTISADLVAVAPDDKNIVAIARKNTPAIYITLNGGSSWENLGNPQETGGDPASVIFDVAVSEIRGGIRYIAAAGTDTLNNANVWYFKIGAGVATWQETRTLTGFTNGDEVRAVAFSPGFSSDAAMLAISLDIAIGISANVRLQVLDTSAQKWNSDAGYAGYPCTVVSDSGINGLSSASLTLAPDYTAMEDDTRKLFIGLTVNGNASAIATSGIYRFDDTVKTDLKTNSKIHSVAFNGSYLVAGSNDTSTVYRCTNPTAATPTFLASTATKCPGGQNSVVVAWVSGSVVAGTSGNESAFAISTDTGTTFNDISLIDTNITNATDVAVSTDGSKVYLVTDDGNDLSLWRMASAWKRVFSQPGTTNYIVRIASQDTNVVYLARKSSTTIYYNNGGGLTQWQARTCNLNIQDLAVESASILYALNGAGSVSKSITAGASWATAVATSLTSGATIISVSTNTLLVGSQNGYVAYSMDGNSSWTLITTALQAGARNVQVIADANFATNKFIYAASDAAGQNIKRWQIGTSTDWADIFNNTLNGGIYGLAINSGKIYALEYDGTQSTLWIHISPATAALASTEWSHSTTTTNLNATPQALKASTGKVWAVSTNQLYSFSDIAIEITLLAPTSGFTSPVNALSGIAHDVSFTWQRPSVATEYELEIALDEGFYSRVTTVTVATIAPVASAIVGPRQAGNNMVNFMPGATYYWKIRTMKPVYSTYSASRYFSVEPVIAVVPGILAPASGRTNMSRKPAFSWNPIAGATEYQFVLSANITMDKPIVDVKIETAGFALTQELDYGSTYFWQIRATQPIESDWSPLANFTVAKQPAEPFPPVIFEQIPPPVIEPPAPSTPPVINLGGPAPEPPPPFVPDYLRGAIIGASALLLAVIVLIMLPSLARFLPTPSTPAGPLKGPSRKAKNIGEKIERLREEIANLARDLTPSITRTGVTGEVGESASISFAVRSFLFMTTSVDKDSGQRSLSPEEEQTLGKKLASVIRALAGRKPLYLEFPEDAALFLQIWAHYGSRDETNRYLTKLLKSKPENAIALLKCYATTTVKPQGSAAVRKEFTPTRYDALAEVVDPDNVYIAIAKLYKFELEDIEEVSIYPADRAIAYQFIRIHHHVKNTTENPGTTRG